MQFEFAQAVLGAHRREVEEQAFSGAERAHVRIEAEPHEARRDLAGDQPHQIAAAAFAGIGVEHARDRVADFPAPLLGHQPWRTAQIESSAAVSHARVYVHARASCDAGPAGATSSGILMLARRYRRVKFDARRAARRPHEPAAGTGDARACQSYNAEVIT
ncbi:hypothetical protein BGC_40840 [Burkholderia sp. 3C]